MSPLDLASFVRRVCDRALQRADEATLHADQRRLLRETLSRFNGHCDPSDPAQPLGLFHLVAQVRGPVEPRLLVHLASFCWLYTCSLDLFDDMQDDDLAGKPHEQAGPAIAVNSALALLFLALDELRLATRLESRIEPRRGYAELFNRISLLTVGAQHADLLGGSAAGSPADVLEMNRGKTASVALFLECASLAAGASLDEAAAYGGVGLDLAGLVQIVDDVRDIYGKDHSPDLLTGKYTYPLACFRESASPAQLAQLEVLLAQRPLPLVEIRELIHEAAAMDRCAEEVEAIRERIHGRLAELSGAPPQHRVLLDIVDA
ncbi:MAG TPA: polyprenyl synthetase family protein, partial [Polyangiaceae bacterium]|nr:polyprenyl synthetase family protein [Polyangiaceae bacterium]